MNQKRFSLIIAAVSLAAQAAGLPYDKHLAGGIIGWKAAGLPTKVGG